MTTKLSDNSSINGLNHAYPSSPQYSVSDNAAAEPTLASPNSTKTTLGKQHIEAIIAEPEISLIKDFRSDSSVK